MDLEDDIHYYANDVVDIYEEDFDSYKAIPQVPQKNYTILKKDNIRQRQENFITRFSSALSISTDSACMDNMLTSDEDKKKDRDYLVGYSNRKIKLCPAPGCDCAIEFHDHGSVGGYDVTCSCSYTFCWNCGEEAHRPVDCETVPKWIMEKKSAESENMKLILAVSKVCLKCKGKIEKRQDGFMKTTCDPLCLCWHCLVECSGHTDDCLYACNRYRGAYNNESEGRREMEKKRFTHYYERWATHESSRQKAVADLNQVQTVHLKRLSVKLCLPESLLQYILEAWLQVVECRRVLKWSYVYGYYLPEQQLAKKHFFDYLQGEAEVMLERLHQCADKESHAYMDTCQDDCDNNFRANQLAGLTNVTRNYFENWVSALEDGLSEVDPQGAISVGKGPTMGECVTPVGDNQLC